MAIALAAAGIGMMAAGMVMQRKADQAARKANAAQAEANAQEMEMSAEEAIAVAENERVAVYQEGRALQSQQQVSYAASGVVVGAGTAGQVTAETEVAALEAGRRIRLNAFQEAMGLRRRASLTRKSGAAIGKQLGYQSTANTLSSGAQIGMATYNVAKNV